MAVTAHLIMIQRLSAGRHPDSDATFWNGYNEMPPLQIPPDALLTQMTRDRNLPKLLLAALFTFIATPIALTMIFLKYVASVVHAPYKSKKRICEYSQMRFGFQKPAQTSKSQKSSLRRKKPRR
jgi:hypothetical protein